MFQHKVLGQREAASPVTCTAGAACNYCLLGTVSLPLLSFTANLLPAIVQRRDTASTAPHRPFLICSNQQQKMKLAVVLLAVLVAAANAQNVSV
jgi:hypothetical protein